MGCWFTLRSGILEKGKVHFEMDTTKSRFYLTSCYLFVLPVG